MRTAITSHLAITWAIRSSPKTIRMTITMQTRRVRAKNKIRTFMHLRLRKQEVVVEVLIISRVVILDKHLSLVHRQTISKRAAIWQMSETIAIQGVWKQTNHHLGAETAIPSLQYSTLIDCRTSKHFRLVYKRSNWWKSDWLWTIWIDSTNNSLLISSRLAILNNIGRIQCLWAVGRTKTIATIITWTRIRDSATTQTVRARTIITALTNINKITIKAIISGRWLHRPEIAPQTILMKITNIKVTIEMTGNIQGIAAAVDMKIKRLRLHPSKQRAKRRAAVVWQRRPNSLPTTPNSTGVKTSKMPHCHTMLTIFRPNRMSIRNRLRPAKRIKDEEIEGEFLVDEISIGLN